MKLCNNPNFPMSRICPKECQADTNSVAQCREWANSDTGCNTNSQMWRPTEQGGCEPACIERKKRLEDLINRKFSQY
jgi:hypothetical protein